MDLLSGAPYIAMRSIMSKLVPSDELGSNSGSIKRKNNLLNFQEKSIRCFPCVKR